MARRSTIRAAVSERRDPTLVVAVGLEFQLPVVKIVLAGPGAVTPKKTAEFRRFAETVNLIASAIMPSTNPINMGVVAVPLLLLNEGGILVARISASRPLLPAVGGGQQTR